MNPCCGDGGEAPLGVTGGAPGHVLRVACVQMNTRDDVAANVRVAQESVDVAADQGARLVVLPETWVFKGDAEGIVATAEGPEGPSNRALAAVAARRGVWLLAGSVYEPASGGLVHNTSALFDPAGRLRAVTAEAGLSLGDRFCLALARRDGLPALTADKQWSTVADAADVTVSVIR